MDKYISDIVTYLRVFNLVWGNYIIGASPGSGKTTWIHEVLHKVAFDTGEKILVIAPRRSLVRQIVRTLMKKGIFDIAVVGVNKIVDGTVDLNEYKFIVFDEAHCLITDAGFNRKMKTVAKMLSELTHCKKFFLTGTPEPLAYMGIWGNCPAKVLVQPNRAKHIVSKIMIYDTIDSIKSQIRNTPNEKSLIFCSSAKDAYEFSTSLKQDNIDAEFCCSSQNPTYGDKSNENVKDQIEQNRKFYCKKLITTSCLYVGLSLEDEELKNVYIIGRASMYEIEQEVNRIRLKYGDEKVVLHIYKPSKAMVNGNLAKELRNKEYKELGHAKWKEKYKGFRLPKFLEQVDLPQEYFKNGKPMKPKFEYEIDMLGFRKCLFDIKEYESYIEHDWIEVLRAYIPNVPMLNARKMGLKATLDKYLSTIENKPMDKTEQREFKDNLTKDASFRKEHWKVSKNSTEKIGYNAINNILGELNMPYRVISKVMRYNKVKGTYWIVASQGKAEHDIPSKVDIVPKEGKIETPIYDKLIEERNRAKGIV